MLLGAFEPLRLRVEVFECHLQDSKAPRLKEEQMECPGGIRRIAHAALASQLSARSADRFERFTIKPPALPEVSDLNALPRSDPQSAILLIDVHFKGEVSVGTTLDNLPDSDLDIASQTSPDAECESRLEVRGPVIHVDAAGTVSQTLQVRYVHVVVELDIVPQADHGKCRRTLGSQPA